MSVDNIPVPAPATTAALEERRVKAMEIHAAATKQIADFQAGTTPSQFAESKIERFEKILTACITGRVATDVEGFLTFTRELCDGIDREFPTG